MTGEQTLYFPKKSDGEVVFDSGRGLDSLDEAAALEGYDVIEEREGAVADEPLSGVLVRCHAVKGTVNGTHQGS